MQNKCYVFNYTETSGIYSEINLLEIVFWIIFSLTAVKGALILIYMPILKQFLNDKFVIFRKKNNILKFDLSNYAIST